jgi:hypothetical protein
MTVVEHPGRPYESPKGSRGLFSTWLKDRAGVAVYENHVFDSSAFGALSFMPARYQAEDGQMHQAPDHILLHGGLPSQRQELIDCIRLEDFGNDVDRCLECFKFDEEQFLKITVKIKDDSREGYGKAVVRIPFSSIDWSAADKQKKSLGLDDVYEVDLELWNEGEALPVDTAAWDRS